jgi:hypothetical protein
MSLSSEAQQIRRRRTLWQQQQLAQNGEHPIRGTFWPRWVPYDHVPSMMASILTRFTKGPHGTGARWGKVGGKSRSFRKVTAARQNGRRHTARSTGAR